MADRLLLEDGSVMLLEDGTAILLESSADTLVPLRVVMVPANQAVQRAAVR